MDTARLLVLNECDDKVIHFIMRSVECFRCPMKKFGPIFPQENASYTIDTRWSNNFSVVSYSGNGSNVICHRNFHFRENVAYHLYVAPNNSSFPSLLESWSSNCHLVYMNPEGDNKIPVYIAISILLVLALLGVIYSVVKKTDSYRRFFNIDEAFTEDLGDVNVAASSAGRMAESLTSSTQQFFNNVHAAKPTKRLKSLDAFRGLALTIMIFVNYGGGGYWFFRHSIWNGITVADLVFPWFIFIMGTAMAIVFKNVHSRPKPKTFYLYRVLKRSIILFALGLFLNSAKINGDLTQLRIPGVLQRFAITYLVTATVEIVISRPLRRNPKFAVIVDQIYLIPHWIFNLALVFLWCGLTFWLSVPECGRGYLGPGGIQDGGMWSNCSGGAAGYIDEWLFGNHRYQRPTFQHLYETKAFYDPEGLLGSLNSIFICFLGLLAGKILILKPDWRAVSIRFVFWAVFFGSVSLILTKASINDGVIPINKNLWSLSFVLATGSMAFVLLLFFWIIIDVTQTWSGEPFTYPGMNSILIYVCHEVFKAYFPISWAVPDTHASQLAMDLWGTAFWVIVSYILYRKGVFVSV